MPINQRTQQLLDEMASPTVAGSARSDLCGAIGGMATALAAVTQRAAVLNLRAQLAYIEEEDDELREQLPLPQSRAGSIAKEIEEINRRMRDLLVTVDRMEKDFLGIMATAQRKGYANGVEGVAVR